MPIWGEVELLCRAVLAEGQKEAESILSRAAAEAARAVAEAQNRSKREYEAQLQDEKSQAHAESKRMVDGAELESRKRVITFREQVIREVLEKLEQRLSSLRQEPGYPEFLVKTLKEGLNSLPGRQFIVEVAEVDLGIAENAMAQLAAAGGYAIELRQTSAIEGGSRTYTGDRRLLFDNSLTARLKRHEEEVRRETWRTVFGSETGGT